MKKRRSSSARRDVAIARRLGIPVRDYRAQVAQQRADRASERAAARELGISVRDYRAQYLLQAEQIDAAEAGDARNLEELIDLVADAVGCRVTGSEGDPDAATSGLYAAVYSAKNVSDMPYADAGQAWIALADDERSLAFADGRLLRLNGVYSGFGKVSARAFTIGSTGPWHRALGKAGEHLLKLAVNYEGAHLASIEIVVGRPGSATATAGSLRRR